MKYGELPVGAKIQFGRYQARDGMQELDLKWTKVTESGLAVLLPNTIHMRFDFPEERLSFINQDRIAHGYNFYPVSNVAQFLNHSGSWFAPAHAGDRAGSERVNNGFLSAFSPDELGAILPQTITVVSPPGSKKTFGQCVEVSQLVTLPSASQLGYASVYGDEGEQIPLLANRDVFTGLTRSGVRDSCHVLYKAYWDVDVAFCSEYGIICPMISLSPDADVSDAADETGCHIVDIKSKLEQVFHTDFFVDLLTA